MEVVLDQEGLIYLVNSIEPEPGSSTHWKVKNRGEYNDSTSCWHWNFDILKNLSEQELWDLYQFCISSWKKSE